MKNPLADKWVFWYMHRNPAVKNIQTNYENNVKCVAKVASVEEFWSVYCNLKRVEELPIISDYHMFRDGIKPMWEDESNVKGGKWMIRLRKGLSARIWENFILALVGNQLGADGDVCGIVVSVRYHEDIISIWNKDSSPEATNKLKDDIKSVLSLPENLVMDYKAHNSSLRK